MILYKKLFFYPSCQKTIFSNKRVFNFEFYLTLFESKIKIQNYTKMGKKAEAGTPKAISNAMKVKGIKSIIIK